VPLQQLTRYAGRYWNKDERRVRRIVLKDGKLFAFGIELMALTDDRFQLIVDPDYTFTFDKTTTGAPQRMTIQEAGETPAAFNRITEFRPATTQLAEYAGYYASEEIDPVYRIVVDDGSLRLNRLKSRPEMLTPLAKDYFEGLGLRRLREVTHRICSAPHIAEHF
jgi:hypothetical protein